ncbi:hypothetical protein, partial [Caulobacter sp. S45]|uniref:hypothetical protein n=1 Tax=Caulobacter sp. S45 TaxID=1641861 RepID=UPI001C2D20B3
SSSIAETTAQGPEGWVRGRAWPFARLWRTPSWRRDLTCSAPGKTENRQTEHQGGDTEHSRIGAWPARMAPQPSLHGRLNFWHFWQFYLPVRGGMKPF